MGTLKTNLGYRDAAAAIRFLITAFGFEEVVVYRGNAENAIDHAELRWPGGGSVTLFSTDPENNSIERLSAAAAADESYPAFSVHIDTDEPDALYDRAVKAGARVVQGISNSPLGTRGFVVCDPEGLYWSFGTPLPRLVRDGERWRA